MCLIVVSNLRFLVIMILALFYHGLAMGSSFVLMCYLCVFMVVSWCYPCLVLFSYVFSLFCLLCYFGVCFFLFEMVFLALSCGVLIVFFVLSHCFYVFRNGAFLVFIRCLDLFVDVC